jgi:hypothetical protein
MVYTGTLLVVTGNTIWEHVLKYEKRPSKRDVFSLIYPGNKWYPVYRIYFHNLNRKTVCYFANNKWKPLEGSFEFKKLEDKQLSEVLFQKRRDRNTKIHAANILVGGVAIGGTGYMLRRKQMIQWSEKHTRDIPSRNFVVESIPYKDQWADDRFYVWGANPDNYYFSKRLLSKEGNHLEGCKLKGSGMASSKSNTTNGKSHPRYVGLITSVNDKQGTIEEAIQKNTAVFDFLVKEMSEGSTVVLPSYNYNFSLGMGLAVTNMNKDNWTALQCYNLQKIKEIFGLKQITVLSKNYNIEDLIDENTQSNFKIGDLYESLKEYFTEQRNTRRKKKKYSHILAAEENY